MKLTALKPITLLILKEMWITILLLLGVSFIVFVVLYASPGNPFAADQIGQVTAVAGETAASTPGSGNWFSHYVSWLAGIVQGDFGTSSRTGLPVLSQVIRVGINTLYLTIGSLAVTLLIAVPIATLSARRGPMPPMA